MKIVLFSLIFLVTTVFSKEVTVSILPQKFFVEKIAGNKIAVNVMVKPGASPATYEPKVSQMKKLSNSEIYFAIGVPFENSWLTRFENANKQMKIVDTSVGIEKLEMEAHSHHDEKEEEHGHKHTGLDPHIWLEPSLVRIQAKTIYKELVALDGKNKEFYKANLENFLAQLDALEKRLENILEPYEHKAFMVFHPSWGYFAKKFHLDQIAIEVEGKEPKPAQLVELIEEAKKHDIKVVFVSPQFSRKGAKTISSTIKANVAVIDPLAYNWDENLIKVANEIANSYK